MSVTADDHLAVEHDDAVPNDDAIESDDPAGSTGIFDQVQSYLGQVDREIERVKNSDSDMESRSALAQAVIDGPLALVRQEIRRLEAKGKDASAFVPAAWLQEGHLSWLVASAGNPTPVREQWLWRAAAAYENTAKLSPSPGVYLDLGRAYEWLAEDRRAAEAYWNAKRQEKADENIAEQADIALRRVDPTGSRQSAFEYAARAEDRPSDTPSPEPKEEDERKPPPPPAKQTQWGFIGAGAAVILLFSSYTIMILLGLGLIVWGAMGKTTE